MKGVAPRHLPLAPPPTSTHPSGCATRRTCDPAPAVAAAAQHGKTRGGRCFGGVAVPGYSYTRAGGAAREARRTSSSHGSACPPIGPPPPRRPAGRAPPRGALFWVGGIVGLVPLVWLGPRGALASLLNVMLVGQNAGFSPVLLLGHRPWMVNRLLRQEGGRGGARVRLEGGRGGAAAGYLQAGTRSRPAAAQQPGRVCLYRHLLGALVACV